MFLPSHDLRRLTPSISAAVDNFLRSRALGRKMEDPEELALFCASSPLPPLPEQIETDSDLFPIFFPKLAKQRSDRSELLPTTLLSTTSPPRQTSSTSTRTRPGNRNVPSLPSLLATWPRLQPSLVKPLLRYLESVVDQESFCLQEIENPDITSSSSSFLDSRSDSSFPSAVQGWKKSIWVSSWFGYLSPVGSTSASSIIA